MRYLSQIPNDRRVCDQIFQFSAFDGRHCRYGYDNDNRDCYRGRVSPPCEPRFHRCWSTLIHRSCRLCVSLAFLTYLRNTGSDATVGCHLLTSRRRCGDTINSSSSFFFTALPLLLSHNRGKQKEIVKNLKKLLKYAK